MTLESFLWSINSLHHTDLRPRLHALRMPALGVYGRRDRIVDPRQAELLNRVAGSRVEMMQEARHFPMLDEADEFYSTALSFLAD
jgi:pimeloyl-ACP methyl ester carboxylesterase